MIVDRLTSSSKYFMYVYDVHKFNNIYRKNMQKWEMDGTSGDLILIVSMAQSLHFKHRMRYWYLFSSTTLSNSVNHFENLGTCRQHIIPTGWWDLSPDSCGKGKRVNSNHHCWTFYHVGDVIYYKMFYKPIKAYFRSSLLELKS